MTRGRAALRVLRRQDVGRAVVFVTSENGLATPEHVLDFTAGLTVPEDMPFGAVWEEFSARGCSEWPAVYQGAQQLSKQRI